MYSAHYNGEQLVASTRQPLLDGARGRPKADVAALTQALVALSRFAAGAGPRLLSAEVNPLIVTQDGAFAADAVIEIEA